MRVFRSQNRKRAFDRMLVGTRLARAFFILPTFKHIKNANAFVSSGIRNIERHRAFKFRIKMRI